MRQYGSAPRMVEEGRETMLTQVAIRAGAMLLSHRSTRNKQTVFDALEICTVTEKKLSITGRSDGNRSGPQIMFEKVSE